MIADLVLNSRITFPAVGYRRLHFFVYNLLLTSPSFIRIQFKTLKLVSVIIKYIIAGLPRARSARGTEPHTHGIWSTSFRLVVT